MIRFARGLLGADRPPVVVRWWHIVLPFVVATLITLLRLPISSWNILWAEDGTVFLTGAYRGEPRVFLETFVGYLHIVPRLLAGFTVLVAPLPYAPLVMVLLSAVVLGALATAIFLFARTRLNSALVCALLVVQVAILPIGGGEVLLNVANLHWFFMVAAFWAAIVTPTSRWLTALQCVIVGLAILSDPLAALLISPLVLVRILGVRPFRGRAHAITWTFIGSSIVQGVASVIATFLRDERSGSSFLPSVREFLEAYTLRVVVDSFVGVTGTSTVAAGLGKGALVVAGVAAIAIIGFVLWKDSERRWLVATFAAASLGFGVVIFVLKWDGLVGIPYGALAPGGRYIVVPVLLLFSAYAIAADSYVQRLAPRRLGWIPVALLAAIVVIPGVIDYRIVNARAGASEWQQEIDRAAAHCAANPELAVAPLRAAPTWFAPSRIPCDVLIAARSN